MAPELILVVHRITFRTVMKVRHDSEHGIIFDIILTVHRDKLYNKSNEMHFLEFYSDNMFYMFRIGELFTSGGLLKMYSLPVYMFRIDKLFIFRRPPEDV